MLKNEKIMHFWVIENFINRAKKIDFSICLLGAAWKTMAYGIRVVGVCNDPIDVEQFHARQYSLSIDDMRQVWFFFLNFYD